MDADKAGPGTTDLFAAGDYAFWSRILEPASKSLVEAARVCTGDRVLDVAAGNGNTALAASRRGAIVTALDPSQAQVGRGRQRARMEGSPIAWVRADGRRLPFADSSFDACLDSFGEEMRVVEMVRVVHSRGVVGIAEWTGEGFFGAYVELLRRHSPGPDRGQYRPDLGQEDFVRSSLAPLAERISVQRRTLRARFATAESFCRDLLVKDPYARPIQAATASERWEEFSEEIRRLVSAWNAVDDGSVLLELKYQLTVVVRPRT
jgi:ubiquinone/menaquinone biosynthesis C-methylase UbiE